MIVDAPEDKETEQLIAQVRESLPELPDAKRERFMRDYALPAYDAGVLTGRAAMTTSWTYLDEFLARHDKFEEKKDERAADEVAA